MKDKLHGLLEVRISLFLLKNISLVRCGQTESNFVSPRGHLVAARPWNSTCCNQNFTVFINKMSLLGNSPG